MSEPTLSIDYDRTTDMLTIEGIKYSGGLFRQLGTAGLAVGRWFQIVARSEDGSLTLRTAFDDPPTRGNTMDLEQTYLASAGAVIALLASQDVAASANGNWNRVQARGTAVAILNAGAATAGTTPTLNVKLQHADDSTGTNAADISGAAFGQVTNAALCASLSIRPGELKPYIRAVATLGGTASPSFPASVTLLYLP